MNAKKDYTVARNQTLQTWHVRFYVDGKRKSHQLGNFCDLTEEQAKAKAKSMWKSLTKPQAPRVPTVSLLTDLYREERMPKRLSTRRTYDTWLNKHIIPQWGTCEITEVKARPVELWLQSLELSPKSRASIRGLVGNLWNYAMWREDVPIQRNPMELVEIKGAGKRLKQPRSLTEEDFGRFIQHLEEPIRTAALVCVCLGLRMSECLALKWGDVDWLGGRLRVERGIVRQHVDDVKTTGSKKHLPLDAQLLGVLNLWKQTTQFSAQEDWIFASPVQLGKLPWSYPHMWKRFQVAATKAGIGTFGTHVMRHTYRSWLDAAKTPIAVQQKLMRHASITTTMDIYGDVITNEQEQANSKVAVMAIRH